MVLKFFKNHVPNYFIILRKSRGVYLSEFLNTTNLKSMIVVDHVLEIDNYLVS